MFLLRWTEPNTTSTSTFNQTPRGWDSNQLHFPPRKCRSQLLYPIDKGQKVNYYIPLTRAKQTRIKSFILFIQTYKNIKSPSILI